LGQLKVTGLTLTGGLTGFGAAIYAQSGLELDHVAVIGNKATADTGGAVVANGATTITDSLIADNSSGDGVAGTDQIGSSTSTPGQVGGPAFGGFGGTAGYGGGLAVSLGDANLTITRSTFRGNRAGNGGDGGDATGGQGGPATPMQAAGAGGAASGTAGRSGGDGGAIAIHAGGSGSATIQDSVIRDNAAGTAAMAARLTAGNGGSGPNTPGAGGLATSGSGGVGGAGGAIWSEAPLTLDSVTIAGNRSGDGGSSGKPRAGDSGVGTVGQPGGTATGGHGGAPGAGAGIYMSGAARVSATRTTIDGNRTGDAGDGGDAAGGRSFPSGQAASTGGDGAAAAKGGGLAIDTTGGSNELHYTDVTSNVLGAVGHGGAGAAPGTNGATGTAGVGGAIWTKTDLSIDTSIIRGNSTGECATTGNPNLTSSAPAETVGPDDQTCPGTAIDPGLGPLHDNGGPVADARAVGDGAGDRPRHPLRCRADRRPRRRGARPLRPGCLPGPRAHGDDGRRHRRRGVRDRQHAGARPARSTSTTARAPGTARRPPIRLSILV